MKTNRILTLLILFSSVASALAQEGKMPSVHGHIFIPNKAIGSPFTNTYFGTSLGVGKSLQQNFPVIDLGNGEIIGLDGSIIFLSLDFEYRQQLKEWIAFEAQANISGRVGSNVLSLISQGFSAVTQLKMGWLIKLYESDRVFLSAEAGVNNARGNFINLSGFIEDLVDGDTTARLSRQVNITTGGIGYRVAWGASKLLGFSSTGQINYGESFDGRGLDFFYRLTGLVDANFENVYGVPMGLAYGLDFNTLPEIVYINNRTAILQHLKLAYTGSPDFSLGLEITFGNIPVIGLDNKVKVSTINIVSQYFF